MACAGLFLATVLAAVTPGLADTRSTIQPSSIPVGVPPGIVSKPIDLSVIRAIHHPAIPSSEAGLGPTSPGSWDEGEARPSISLGPLRTQFGGVTGRHMHLATVKLEGISIFGASIGGSLDSRSARITLSWPTSP